MSLTAYPTLRFRLVPTPALKLRFLPGVPGATGPAGPQGPTGPQGPPGTSGAPIGAEYITSTADATLTAERVLTDTATVTWDRTVAGQIKANATASGGAPIGAQYITSAADATLTAERVLTDTATVTWDFSTAGQAKANTAAGGGNVSNVGTPVDNQIAVWKTSTTIEGDANLTWSGTVLTVGGSTSSATFSGTTDSTSPTTGTVIVSGGVGIAKTIWVGGDLYVNSAAPAMRIRPTSGVVQRSLVGESASGAARWVIAVGNGTAESGSNAGSNFSFRAFNDGGTFLNDPFFIRRSDGSVVLGGLAAGTVVGSSELTVKGSNTRNAAVIQGTTAAVTTLAISFLNSASTQVGLISFTDTATTYATSSDARLKSDIVPFSRGREIIDRLPVNEFTWAETGDRDVGLLAQEVEAVQPLAVVKGEGEPGEKGFRPWSVDYSKYVPALIQALQDAFREIDQLKQRMRELSNGDDLRGNRRTDA